MIQITLLFSLNLQKYFFFVKTDRSSTIMDLTSPVCTCTFTLPVLLPWGGPMCESLLIMSADYREVFQDVTWPPDCSDSVSLPSRWVPGGPSTLWWGGWRWHVLEEASRRGGRLSWAESLPAEQRWFPPDWTSERPPALCGPRSAGQQTAQQVRWHFATCRQLKHLSARCSSVHNISTSYLHVWWLRPVKTPSF